MPKLIDEHRSQIEALCRKYSVRMLDVFGSAMRDDFDPTHSDIDFLVEFEKDSELNTFHACLDRHEAWRSSSAVRNRYIKADIEATREFVHAA